MDGSYTLSRRSDLGRGRFFVRWTAVGCPHRSGWINPVMITVWLLMALGGNSAAEQPRGNIVKVTGDKGHWELTVNGRPFYIKGVGVGHHLSEDQSVDFLWLAEEMGANAVRTWGISQAPREYLDRAHSYGLLVDVGFWLNPVYANGTCSYLTDNAYMAEARQQVLTYIQENRHHPAILAWNIGNETIYWTKDEKERVGFCRFLEKLIQEVHQLDPDHPVIYTSAYITDAEYIAKFVPSLDILGVNVYGAVQQTHSALEAQQKIPIVFTEFGPPGPWDLPKDENQRPREFNDQEKADFYVREAKAVFENKGRNLGGFAFFLGETTQISLTWWNVNYGGSRKLDFIRLKDLYTETSDSGQYPFIVRMDLSKVDRLHPGEEVQIALDVSGEEPGITYAYLASTEIDSDLVENPNERIQLQFNVEGNKASLKAPTKPGIYRIYGLISDRGRNYTSTLSRTIRVVAQ